MKETLSTEQKLAETRAELAIALMRQIYDPDEAATWLTTPQPNMLNGACPIDLCATDAGWEVLRSAIDQVLDGVHG